jgi:hypothetical protein
MQQELQTAFQACEERKLDLLMTVVPQVIDPNSIVPLWDKNGIRIEKASLLHVACFSGSYDCVKYLLRCGADASPLDVLLSHLPISGHRSTSPQSLDTPRL